MRISQAKIFVSLLAIVWLSAPTIVSADGADEIFNYIGRDKPAEWQTMEREARFEYLENLGVYPPDGSPKYQGRTDDLTRYFAQLGIEQPDKWNTLTFTERKNIVDEALVPKLSPSLNESVSDVKHPSSLSWKIILAIGAIILGVLIILASYRVDWLRANRSK